MIGLDAKKKKKGKFIVGVWFGCKKKKRNLFLSFLADSVFLKEKFFWLFLFSKEKKKGILFSEKKKKRFCFSERKFFLVVFVFYREKRGSCFLKRKKKDFFCFKNSVVSVMRNSVF